MPIQIISFQPHHQSDINDLINSISVEFGIPVQDQNSNMISLPDKYWVAVSNGKVIGTIALINLKNNSVVLKRMFVESIYRGSGISQSLLDILLKWSSDNGKETIYLGTMSVFHAAHKFYSKNGFERIEPENLPNDFPVNPLDSLFYRRSIK